MLVQWVGTPDTYLEVGQFLAHYPALYITKPYIFKERRSHVEVGCSAGNLFCVLSRRKVKPTYLGEQIYTGVGMHIWRNPLLHHQTLDGAVTTALSRALVMHRYLVSATAPGTFFARLYLNDAVACHTRRGGCRRSVFGVIVISGIIMASTV